MEQQELKLEGVKHSHKAFRTHALEQYLTDTNGASKIAEGIIGRPVQQQKIHEAARRETEVREENGKSPCYLVARSVAFFDIAWVKEWAKSRKDKMKLVSESAEIADIKKKIDELQKMLAKVSKEAK